MRECDLFFRGINIDGGVFMKTDGSKKLAAFGVFSDACNLVSVIIYRKVDDGVEKISEGLGYPEKFGITGHEKIIGVSSQLEMLAKSDGGDLLLVRIS